MFDDDLPKLFSPGRLAARHIALIILFGLIVLIPGILPRNALLSAHEVLAAQPAKEMLHNGRWLVQQYAGVPRYEKPPTTSWLIAASMALFRTDAEWAVRVPSLVAGIAASVVLGISAARWLGAFAGVLCALIQLTTLWLQTQAALSEADIHLVLWMTLSMALFALGNIPHPQGAVTKPWVRRCFAASLGVLFLFKGPIPLLFCLLAIGLYILIRRDRAALKFFADPIAIAIFLLLLVLWPVLVLIYEPAAIPVWKQELFGYAGAETFGAKSRWTYLLNIPVMLLPWLPLLAVAAWSGLARRWWRSPLGLFLICWMAPGLCILQWASYKSVHYAFPLLPPLSIAMAIGLIDWIWIQEHRPIAPRRLSAILIVLSAGTGVVLTAALKRPVLPHAVPMIIGVVGIGLLITLYLEGEGKKRRLASVASLFATVALAIVWADFALVPIFKANPASRQFSERINHLLINDTLHLVDFGTDDLVWYLRVPLRRIDDAAQFSEQTAAPPQGLIALTRQRTLPGLSQKFRVEQLDRAPDSKRPDVAGRDATPVLVRLRPLQSK